MKVVVFLFFTGLLLLASGAKRRANHTKMEFHQYKSGVNQRTTRRLTHMDTENSSVKILGMTNQNVTSGGSVIFKCKVNKKPKDKIHFTWFKNDHMISNNHDHRFVVTTRPRGSKLKIKSLYTLDTGTYKCVVSEKTRSLQATAFLYVSFERPPPLFENEIYTVKMPNSKCEKYEGVVCKNYLFGKSVFIDAFQQQNEMEDQIGQALKLFSQATAISSKCRKFALPAFCYFVFPQCDKSSSNVFHKSKRLCREDCNILKNDVCFNEFVNNTKDPYLKTLFEIAKCSDLSSTECLSLGVVESNRHESCYHGNGSNYRGRMSVAATGETCLRWPDHMTKKFVELKIAENYCRNPGGLMEKPWCFVSGNERKKSTCGISKCEISIVSVSSNTILPLVSVGVFVSLIGICVLSYLIVSSRRNELTQLKTLNQLKVIPKIDLNSIRIFAEIGFCKMGKVYQGSLEGDPRFPKQQSYAFKFLHRQQTKVNLKEFKREIKLLSELDHPKITNLRAFNIVSKLHCMVFDYTDQVDLNEHLRLNSPEKREKKQQIASFDKFLRPIISNDWLANAASQIASGMEYLTSNDFIHRDLAARNILVCGNMELKISNLGIIKDSYFSCYYENKHGNFMPIRWMAPESILSWKFSHKSTVWSFGVLLWEMFNYGSQPYCEYSNQEVLEMISHGQLLDYPDQCPAKMYSLMQECWSLPQQDRPSFSETKIEVRLCLFFDQLVWQPCI